MRLKEREVDRSNTPPEYLSLIDKVSAPPIINMDAIERARDIVKKADTDEFRNFTALRLALTLGLYNFCVANNPTKSHEQAFLERLRPLIQIEKTVANPKNPLPTIGWEVETIIRSAAPTTPGLARPKFNDFFKAFEWFNFGNLMPDYWEPSMLPLEYSPLPSYSAQVSARLLSELIKGGFIPSLNASTNPEDIRKYLSDKLVSLHINLGIPPNSDKFQLWEERVRARFIFSSMFALAYTCSDRLERKTSNTLDNFKRGSGEAVDTNKSTQDVGRFEVKAFEVRDQSVYRLMRDSQHLAAALFEALSSNIRYPGLASEWKDADARISQLYDKKGFKLEQVDRKPDFAAFAKVARLTRGDLAGLGINAGDVFDKLADGTNARPETVSIGQGLRLFIRSKSAGIAKLLSYPQLAA